MDVRFHPEVTPWGEHKGAADGNDSGRRGS